MSSLFNNRWSIVAVIFLLAILIQFNIFMSWDVLWLLQVTHRWIHGGKYFYNFIDVDPPMILYLYALPQWLAELCSISAVIVLRIFVFALALWSLIFTDRLCKKIFDKTMQSAIVVMLAFCYLLLPAHEFAQRELLMLILIMPYLWICCARLQNKNITTISLITAGIMAGIGFAIKPYFSLIWIFTELYLMFERRSLLSWWRIETALIIFIQILYIISVLVYSPQFLHLILPYVLHFYLNEHPLALIDKIFNEFTVIWFVAVLMVYALYGKFHDKKTMMVLLVASLAMLIVVVWQGQTWYYHFIPLIALSLLLVALSFVQYYQCIQGQFSNISLFYLMLLIVGIGIVIMFPFGRMAKFTTYSLWTKMSVQSDFNQLITEIKQDGKQGPVYAFDVGLIYFPVIIYSQVKYPYRLPHFWMISTLVRMEHETLTPEQQMWYQKGKQWLLDILVDDFKQHPPALVMVNGDDLKPYYANFVDYFLSDPRFRQEWRNYVFIKKINYYNFYRRK